jgi:hypothetical protein
MPYIYRVGGDVLFEAGPTTEAMVAALEAINTSTGQGHVALSVNPDGLGEYRIVPTNLADLVDPASLAWDHTLWENLVGKVSHWSEGNFGYNEVRTSPRLWDVEGEVHRVGVLDLASPVVRFTEAGPSAPCVGLGGLAPILGLAEEIGEYGAAQSPEETEDALGDIIVYMADALGRLGVAPGTVAAVACRQPKPQFPAYLTSAMAREYGKLAHTVLKRAQRIRGMDDDAAYRGAVEDAFGRLLAVVNTAAQVHCTWPAVLVGNLVFHRVVQKRNWRVNVTSGV